MGWAIFPDLKDPEFMCQEPCCHSDCDYWRRVGTSCRICEQEIVAGEKYMQDDEGFVHAVCVWQKEEARQRDLAKAREES